MDTNSKSISVIYQCVLRNPKKLALLVPLFILPLLMHSFSEMNLVLILVSLMCLCVGPGMLILAVLAKSDSDASKQQKK